MVDKIKADNKTQEAWHFRRGLGQEFISELKALADKPSWFTDILADQDLILGIRKDYLNVYVDGQSLFKIVWNSQNKKMNVTKRLLLMEQCFTYLQSKPWLNPMCLERR